MVAGRIKRLNGGEGGRDISRRNFLIAVLPYSHSPSASDGTLREFSPINLWRTRISSLSRIVVLDTLCRGTRTPQDRFLRLPAFDENRSGRDTRRSKKFLSDDLHVEANDRKSRFMSFTLMLTLWPLTYHFFAIDESYGALHHIGVHDATIRLIVRTRSIDENRLIIGQPKKESCPEESSFSTSRIKFESLSI